MDPDMGSAARAEALGPQTTSRPLRAWKKAALGDFEESSPRDFLVTATPGAGKTTFALTLAQRLLTRREVARVIVVAPTDHLRMQWADAADAMGIVLDPNLTNAVGPVRAGTSGYVTTYAQGAGKPMLRAAPAKAAAAHGPGHHREDAGAPGRGAPRRRRPVLGRSGRGGLRPRGPPA